MKVTKKRSTSSTTRRAKKNNREKGKRRTVAKQAQRRTTSRLTRTTRARPHKVSEAATFVYECTREGCGYRIWRDDKGEPGQLRFDLKCPKCHNESFRCLGKGDLPESFNKPLAPTAVDFEKLDRVGTSTN